MDETPQKSERSPQAKNPQIVFSWKAPMRAYMNRSPQIIRFYLAVALLVSLIIFFFGDRILLIPLWALLFLFYVFTVTPPPDIEHKITQFGIETAQMTFRWEALDHFFFTRRMGYDILVLVTAGPWPYYAYLVVPTEEVKDKVTMLLSEQVIYMEEPKKNFTDKATEWLLQFVPDERRNHTPLKENQLTSSQKP